MSLSLKTALHNHGWSGTLMAHVMNWFGNDQTHKVTRYKSNDPAAIHNILTICKQVGIDGVIPTWQGLQSPFVNEATQEMCRQCATMGLKLALLLDPWAARKVPTSKEASLLQALEDPGTQAMLNSPAYIKEKAVLDFSTGADFSKIAPKFPKLQFWMRHQHYSWPETTNTLAVLKADNAHPNMKIPGVCASFFDGGFVHAPNQRDWNRSVWSDTTDTRIIPHEAGNTYLDQVALVPKAAPYAAIVTLNDSEEQTDTLQFLSMLTGIRVGA